MLSRILEERFQGHEGRKESFNQTTMGLKHIREKPWSTCYELHVRLKNFVSHNNVAKAIECKDGSFSVQYSADSGVS